MKLSRRSLFALLPIVAGALALWRKLSPEETWHYVYHWRPGDSGCFASFDLSVAGKWQDSFYGSYDQTALVSTKRKFAELENPLPIAPEDAWEVPDWEGITRRVTIKSKDGSVDVFTKSIWGSVA